MLARADKDDNLNETLERVFNHIESSAASGDAENDFAGLFDDFDVNSKAIGETVAKRNKVLAELLNGVAQMPLFSTAGSNPDLFGDAYEYLMGMYAANAGKKGGQYFTPADVSELLARLGTIGKTKINKVYDPACGSGSLLLKVEKVLGKDNIERGFYGQEIDLTTYNLCRINMFLHNIEFDKFSIVREDTLLSPQHGDDQPFELIVSNPPYICTDEIAKLMPEVRDFEPMEALDGKEDGLYFYRKIIGQCKQYLNPEGHLLFEIGYDQGQKVSALMREIGFHDVQVIKDLARKDRVVTGML